MKCEVWSVKTLLRLSLKKNRLSREGHARDRLALNYRSFILGKLPPPACPGLCYINFLKIFECGYTRGTRAEQHERNPRKTQTRITRITRGNRAKRRRAEPARTIKVILLVIVVVVAVVVVEVEVEV